MITKETTTINTKAWIRNFIISLSILLTGTHLMSCNDDKDLSRKEHLIVSDTLVERQADILRCALDNSEVDIYVFSNIDYTIDFKTNDKDRNWITVTDKGFNSTIGARVYGIRPNAMEEDYVKRYGTLSFTVPELDLGAFLQVEQGMWTFIEEKFDWLPYGSSSPFINTGARPINDWTTAQKEKGWTSTTADEATPAAMYGKIGYVMLGNETTGANLITPITRKIINDSILMLRFDALAFVDQSGNKDANKLNVAIQGGGEFIDGTLSKTIDLAYYDPNGEYVDEDKEKTIWKTEGRTHILYIVDTETNPRTQQTRIVFSTGNFNAPGTANRVFMDNIYVHPLDEGSYYLVEEYAPDKK